MHNITLNGYNLSFTYPARKLQSWNLGFNTYQVKKCLKDTSRLQRSRKQFPDFKRSESFDNS